MLEKFKSFWNSLDEEVTVNKRELVLGAAVCALAGVVIGTFLSPNVNVTVASNNCLDAGEEAEEKEETEE